MTAELAFGSAKNGEYFMTGECQGGDTGFSGHGSAAVALRVEVVPAIAWRILTRCREVQDVSIPLLPAVSCSSPTNIGQRQGLGVIKLRICSRRCRGSRFASDLINCALM
jgi:hypothetical protein